MPSANTPTLDGDELGGSGAGRALDGVAALGEREQRLDRDRQHVLGRLDLDAARRRAIPSARASPPATVSVTGSVDEPSASSISAAPIVATVAASTSPLASSTSAVSPTASSSASSTARSTWTARSGEVTSMPASLARCPSGAGDGVDADRAVDEHDLTEVDAPVVVLAVVGLEVLDGLGRRGRPFLVDGQVVLLGVAHRRQHVLDVQHVRAVVDTGAEGAPQRRRPVEGDDRPAVDLGDDVAGLDHVTDLGEAGERPLGDEDERGDGPVADGPFELLGASQVAPHDLDERDRLRRARRLGT